MINLVNCRYIHHLLFLILVVLISGYSCLGEFDSEGSLRDCRAFLKTNPVPYPLDIHYSAKHDGAMGHVTKFSGRYVVDCYFRIHQISAVVEGEGVTSVCVSIEDVTAFTSYRRKEIASVTFHTQLEVPVSIVNVSTSCWRATKLLESCNPVFIPMPGFIESALFNHSPLSKKFWNYVQDDTIYHKGWIWGMDFSAENDSFTINSSWLLRLNVSSLTNLYMNHNDWKRPRTLIGSLPKLTRLDIPYNNIEIMPKDTLSHVPQLKRLALSHNNFSQLPFGIEKLENLRTVEMGNPIGNATLTISDEEVATLGRVETLMLENTKLKANATKILSLPKLKFLNISGCFLGNIHYDSGNNLIDNSPLLTLDLSLNNLTEFPRNTFPGMTHLTSLSLQGNELETCSNSSLNNLFSLQYLDLSRNNFKFLSADCFHGLHSLTDLDLSWNMLTQLEPLLFRNSTLIWKLDLSHNNLSILSYDVFLPLGRLKYLDLSFNHLIQIPTLSGNDIESLLLANNDLTQIFNLTDSTKQIQFLDLSNNHIQELYIKDVHTLNLSYNSLSHIPVEMWDGLSKANIIDLGGNRFDCCHNDTFLLQNKLENSHNSLKNLHEGNVFTCFVNDGQEVLLEKFQYNSTICSEVIQPQESRYIEIGIGVFLLVTVVAAISGMLYFYRTELTYISHLFKMKKRGWEKDDDERYKSCNYDAFVCYSAKNLKWILDELIPNLEKDPDGYRLCLHDRDFTLGAAIGTNVVVSLEKSRKVIFVLSQDFIQSKWCQWELEMAKHKMFEENRGYIILIELERLDKENLPKHLRYLMNTRTYLEWPQDAEDDQKLLRCRKRLKDALGDSIFKRTGKIAPVCTVLDL